MASGSTNPTIEDIKKLINKEKFSSKDIDELRRDINEATAVLSKYTTVKGKLFGELQEDKARLASLKDELKDAEESFEKAKQNFINALSDDKWLKNLGINGSDFNKAFKEAGEKLESLTEQVNAFTNSLSDTQLKEYYEALKDGSDAAIKAFLAKNSLGKENLDLIREEQGLREQITNILQKQNKEIRTSVDVESQAARMRKQGWSDIKRGATEAFRIGKDFLDVWGKIDQAASKFAKTIGTGAVGMERLRKNAIESVQKGRLGAKYNVSADELIGLQESYSNTIGRNIQISASDQENMAAMFRVMGESGGDFAAKLENFGLSYTDAANKAGKMFKEAGKYGISFDKYSKNVANNIKLAQNYTFKNGVKGLESMAKKATAMKLDMQQVAAFADKVSTVEGAINTGAQLQVLGGPFAQFSDPMGMLNEGLTNMEGLQDRFEKMIGSLARFNSQTGEVSVSAFNKQRIKVAAEAMGMSYDQVMETTMAKGRQNYIGQQIEGKGYSKEEQDLLKNIATINEGKAMVSYVDRKGNKQEVNLREQRLTADQLEDIKKQTQSETDDIKDIAIMLHGWDDVMQGTKKQWDNNAATAIERSGLGEKTKGIVASVAESNILLNGIFAIVKAIAAGIVVMNVVNGVGNFMNGGGIKGTLKGFNGKGAGATGGVGGNVKVASRATFNGSERASISRNYGAGLSGTRITNATMLGRTANTAGRINRVIEAGHGASLSKGALRLGKAAGRLSKFGGAAAATGGIMSGLFTGIDEFTGNKNYSTGKKVGRTAGSAAGAAIGSALGTMIPIPVVGTMLGGIIGEAIGKWAGGGFANQKRRARKAEEFGIDGLIKGDYKVSDLKKIAEGRVERGSKLEERLKKNGDYEAAMEIAQKVKNQTQNVEKQTVRTKNMSVTFEGDSNSLNMARGGMLHGPSHAQGGMPILGSNIEVEGGEFVVNKRSAKKFHNTLNKINNMGNGGIIKPRKMEAGGSVIINQTGGKLGGQSFGVDKITVDPINVNISGSIKLEGANGQKAELTADLLKNPQFISEITKLITKQMNINIHGANVINRPDA